MFNSFVSKAQKYFPDLKIKYKNQSLLMKILGKLLFFNKDFMTKYITTLGSTIYFPSQEFVINNDRDSSIVLLHELVHMYDAKKLNKYLFGFLYLFPQILFLLFFPALLLKWWIAIIFLVFAAPIPSYFRAKFEKKAYCYSLYTTYKLDDLNSLAQLMPYIEYYYEQFNGPYYYWMYPFNSVKEFLIEQSKNIVSGQMPPFEPELNKIISDIISAK